MCLIRVTYRNVSEGLFSETWATYEWLHHWRKCLFLHEQLLAPALKGKRCSSHLRLCCFFWNLPYIQPTKNKGRKAVNKPLNIQAEMITNGLVPEILKEECLSSKSGSVRLLWGGNMCAEPGQMGHSRGIIVFKREYPRVFGLWLDFIKNGPTGRAPISILNILGGLMFTVWRPSLGGAQVWDSKWSPVASWEEWARGSGENLELRIFF